MQNIGWKIVLIVITLGFCLYSVYPPGQKIRLGKDLRGGTSLIYVVNIPEDVGNKQGVLTQTIEVLKERVNPKGVLDISMQPLGLDRIEIVMPLPTEAIKKLRKQFDDSLAELLQAAQVKADALDDALKANRAVELFGGNNPDRVAQLESLQKAYNELQKAQKALDDFKAAGGAGGEGGDQTSERFKLEQAVADAQFEFDTLRATIRRTDLDRARMVRILSLPQTPETKKDAANKPVLDEMGKPIQLPSQREQALTTLKSEFPHLAGQIDKVVSAFDVYSKQRTTLDDPEDLMRLLRGAGVLEFHIAVQPGQAQGVNIQQMRDELRDRGPENTESTVARWFPINDLKQWYDTPEELAFLESDPESYFAARRLVGAKHEGQYYLLLYVTRDKSMTHDAESQWSVESAGPTIDERSGREAVAFHLDPNGGALMSRLTGPHVNHPMAIVLDGQVYSAPNLISQIGARGQIVGNFTKADIQYLIRVLAAGSLQARLSPDPIAINTLGPTIGQDNLMAGLWACLWSVIAVAVFMLVYYFQAGLIANIAVAANAVFIFGVMAMIDGTFTLPGLAGIALTIGTAVDANILIYERIREELETREVDLRGAIRLGYNKALSAIIDSNLTNLWVCIALMLTATTEVKGFALTLMIGIVGTLFTALFMTKQIYTIGTEVLGIRRMPMLATTVPVVHRILQPNWDWIGLKRVFIPLSVALVLASWVMIGMRGNTLFDTEFRGGLTITMNTAKLDAEGKRRLHLKLSDVEDRVHQIGQRAESLPPSDAREVLRKMKNADVLTVGEDISKSEKQITSSSFQVKVARPSGVSETASFKDVVVEALVNEFKQQLDVQQPITFAGENADRHTEYTFPITDVRLGQVIHRPQYQQNVSEFAGGVAVVLDDINPPVSPDELRERIKQMRNQPDFTDANARNADVIGLEPADPNDPTKGYKSAVLLVSDPALNYTKVDFEKWDTRLAKREWQLVSEALSRPPTFEQVSEFSSAVAATLRASALVAVVLSLLGILVYIWVRFGSLRYSGGAVLALVHDCSIGVGALALSQLIGETAFGKALLLEPFHIDMGVVAAILTLIGYSLNDTIVVLDRIRENRGKLPIATAETVNRSINQTFSRTMLTSFTMLISLFILYIEGGSGIRPFAFVMLVGMMVGTYSSVAIAAPLVTQGHDEPEQGLTLGRRRPEPMMKRETAPAPM